MQHWRIIASCTSFILEIQNGDILNNQSYLQSRQIVDNPANEPPKKESSTELDPGLDAQVVTPCHGDSSHLHVLCAAFRIF